MSMDNSFQQPQVQPAPSGESPLKIILIVLGIVGVLGLVCCGSIVGLGYFGFNQIAENVKSKLVGSSSVTDEIGSIESVSLNLVATGEEQQTGGGDEIMVFDVVGTNGSGRVLASQNGATGDMDLISFRTSDGREIPIDSDTVISDDVDGPSFDLPL